MVLQIPQKATQAGYKATVISQASEAMKDTII